MNKSLILIIIFIAQLFTTIHAKLRLPQVFCDNMVLQCGKPISIWGTASPNSDVKILFMSKKYKTRSMGNGNWEIVLPDLPVTKEPQKMIIKDSNSIVTIRNILIGEVWLASGQSNIAYSMERPASCQPPRNGRDIQENELIKADQPFMRVLYVENRLNTDSLPTEGWQTIDSNSIKNISAVGYFFGKSLIDSLNVPVGIISSSWGGTMIEEWTPKKAYLESPIYFDKIEDGKLHNIPISRMFDSLIKPIIPYTLRGFIWYQGESNLISGCTEEYSLLQQTLISSWRNLWNDQILPFYYVQIAPHSYSQWRDTRHINNWESLPRFWEAQTRCMAIPNTGMVVTTDLVDDISDIHPAYKWTVGHRLSLWALAKTYGHDITFSGPQIDSVERNENKIILYFKYAKNGLESKNGSPNWFKISEDGILFYNAKATINKNTVILESPNIQKIKEVKFGWDEKTMPNLFNKEGLPAIPFKIKID